MSKNKRFVRNENNMLLGIIGDEDTVTGFLLAGIGERSENSTNFLKVKSTTTNEQIEEFFHGLITRKDIGIVLIRGAGDRIGFAVGLGLLEGLLGPDAGLQVRSLLLEEVHRHIEKLQRGAAAEEDDFIIIRNREQLLPERAAFVHYGIPLFGTVRNTKKGNSGSLEITDRLD